MVQQARHERRQARDERAAARAPDSPRRPRDLGVRVAPWAVVAAFAALHGPFLAQRYQPNSWLFADGSFYFTTVRALAEHGRLEQKDLQPRSWYERDLGWNRRLGDDWSNVAMGRGGGWYPKHPILLPAASVPLYLLFGVPGTFATNVLLNLAFAWLVYRLSRRFCDARLAAVLAATAAALPFAKEMSYTFSNDVLGADLVLGAMELAMAGRFGWAGVLTGLALWSRVTNAAFLPALLVVGWDRGGGRAVLRAALFSLLPLAAYGALNAWMFGAPWITSYQRVIVREGGAMTVASHSRLFNVPMAGGLRREILGPDGILQAYPLLYAALPGLLVLVRRRRAMLVAMVLFSALPVLTFAKYDWYRPHFLYPVFGGAMIGLAALGGLLLPPQEEAPGTRPRRRLFWSAAALLAAASIGIHFALRPDPAQLSTHVHEAAVFLDDIPCDYWNPQEDRWECSHFDPGGWAMTGRILREPVRVRGVARRGIWLHPNPTTRWRRVVWQDLPASRVVLAFALGDASHRGPVEVEIIARGSAPQSLRLSEPGEEVRRTVDIAAGGEVALELRVRSQEPGWKHLVVEGRLVR